MATVTLDGVRKSYGAREVVHGVGCAVGDGELVVVVGPSGCGKSTLLRMVAGLEAVSAGTVTIDGRVINGVEPKDRDIAMVFQNYALYPHMSVYNNMAYGLRMRRMDRALIGTRVERATAILQIEGLPERKPRPLSGGQRQRVAMGRAIVRDPKVFLFDEPLSNLDAQLRVQMRVELKRLQQELGTTSIYVTHDQVEAMNPGRPPRRDECRHGRPDRPAARPLRATRDGVRRRVHRLAGDEPSGRPDRAARRGDRRLDPGAGRTGRRAGR
jgi:sn-glycerol 3-phosphate transport system ATP-binding protein